MPRFDSSSARRNPGRLCSSRSNKVRTSPGTLDTFGGHVSFELGLLASPNAPHDASLQTAVREAREEILVSVDGNPYLIQQKDFRQIGRVGQFACNEPANVEYATAYVLFLPYNARVGPSPFELRDGTVDWLPVEEIPWEDLLLRYRDNSAAFVDGISRLLSHAVKHDDIREFIDQAPTR